MRKTPQSEAPRPEKSQPAYLHILDQLRGRISRGDYAVGDKLPTDEALMTEFGVCRYTARAAVQILVNDQVVRRYRGRGSFVVATPETSGQWALTSLDDLIDHSFAHTVRVVESEIVAAKDEPAAAAALDVTGLLQRLLVVREGNNALPYTCSVVYLPADLVKKLPKNALTGRLKGQIIRMLETHCGLRVHRARQVAGAEPALGAVARHLEVPEGAPLLVLERTYTTADGRAVEHTRVFCRPDRYRQTVEFERRRARPTGGLKN